VPARARRSHPAPWLEGLWPIQDRPAARAGSGRSRRALRLEGGTELGASGPSCRSTGQGVEQEAARMRARAGSSSAAARGIADPRSAGGGRAGRLALGARTPRRGSRKYRRFRIAGGARAGSRRELQRRVLRLEEISPIQDRQAARRPALVDSSSAARCGSRIGGRRRAGRLWRTAPAPRAAARGNIADSRSAGGGRAGRLARVPLRRALRALRFESARRGAP
jgi:hypothetical protein